MSETERFTPPEAENFSADEQKEQQEKKVPSDTTINKIMHGPEVAPEASGVPRNREDAKGHLITPEKAERYHHPESTKEIEPGVGPNPTQSGPPNDIGTSPAADTPATDDPGSASDSPNESDTGTLSEPDPETQEVLDEVERLREERQRELEEDLQTFQEQKAPPGPPGGGGTPSPPGDDVSVQSDRDVPAPPIPDDLVGEIVHIKNLPVEERRAAVADLISRTDLLGNRPEDVKKLHKWNSGKLSDGKGVFFEDETGYRHIIRYDE